MKRGGWAIPALFAASLIWMPPAAAVDDAEITHLAKQFILESYLGQFCDLAPSEAVKGEDAETLKEIMDSEESEDTAPYDKWTADQKAFAAQYAGFIGDLTMPEFCARLKSDYESAGGALVAKP